MNTPEHIEFVFKFEYDPQKRDDFMSIWNLGFKMLQMVEDYEDSSDSPVEIIVNESPGAIADRQSASV